MQEYTNRNFAEIAGTMLKYPSLSHENRNEKFYTMPIAVQRLSGTNDILNVLCREKILSNLNLTENGRVHVFGQIRSFNNKSNHGAKLIISLFARDLNTDSCEDRNDILLQGTICKKPNLRVTPLGREICDFMLAVNRRYGRSDYIPCIAWGIKARETAGFDVGTTVALSGRFQSRNYIKIIDSQAVEKTAYEVSVIDLEKT